SNDNNPSLLVCSDQAENCVINCSKLYSSFSVKIILNSAGTFLITRVGNAIITVAAVPITIINIAAGFNNVVIVTPFITIPISIATIPNITPKNDVLFTKNASHYYCNE